MNININHNLRVLINLYFIPRASPFHLSIMKLVTHGNRNKHENIKGKTCKRKLIGKKKVYSEREKE